MSKMLALARLLIFSLLSVLATANTEKTVFVAPPALTIPNIHPGLDALRLFTLAPTKHRSSLRTQLNVRFPSDDSPRGSQHWYILDGLRQGQRYEVRVCWAATQPSLFWLSTYPIQQVFETPDLISALAAYSEQQQEISPTESEQYPQTAFGTGNSTVLFLQIESAADFYTTNKSLMSSPPPVDVDIILDPFLLNVLPKSLVPTVIYIALLAVGSWYLSGAIWKWLEHITDSPGKQHHE